VIKPAVRGGWSGRWRSSFDAFATKLDLTPNASAKSPLGTRAEQAEDIAFKAK